MVRRCDVDTARQPCLSRPFLLTPHDPVEMVKTNVSRAGVPSDTGHNTA